MQLNDYQKRVLNDLTLYMQVLNSEGNLFRAWNKYWTDKDIRVGDGGVWPYNNSISGVPHICMKVPTGGGKTFMACAAVKRIFDGMERNIHKVVVWLVPSDTILTQTVKNLSDPNHDYHKRLLSDFGGRVGIYTKEMLLNGQNFSPDTVREMLTVCVFSYASLRIDSTKKDVRKVFQENGNLLKFADYFQNKELLLADTPDTALIQVLRQLSPVTIVDESHNAESSLSVEMLNNLNPSFVLDLTATPRNNSNIISYVDARDLKKENMVKLPVIVYNRDSRNAVIQDAIQLRASIEKQAMEERKRGGKYIRPILLFQAQPKTSDDSETFDRVKKILLDMGIPEDEIAIKTSKVDDIGRTDLLSEDCPIRYIITVNALKEGWDCPFAYILASLANKTSTVDVEQIVGRILRQPHATKHGLPLLNTSYVLTCSQDFHSTLDKIVSGLNNAGFSRKDCRLGCVEPQENNVPEQSLVQLQMDFSATDDTFNDITTETIRDNIFSTSNNENRTIENMINSATLQSESYEREVNKSVNDGFMGGDLGNMLNQYAIKSQFIESAMTLKLPQFFSKSAPDLFGGEYDLLNPENLSEGFTLNGQDINISFELATGEMYTVDIQADGEAVPQFQRTRKEQSKYLREWLAKMPAGERVNHCTDMLCRQINKNNRYGASDVSAYVKRIVANMTEDELSAMETAIPSFAQKILEKIKLLEDEYREKQFYKWLDSRKIVCRPYYELQKIITPTDVIDSIPFSLYEVERNDMNKDERRVIDAIVGLDNILWWHRIIERKDFNINGFINHYPDFMIMTKRGNLILVEVKGDWLGNDDSKKKLELGRKWAACSDSSFEYFMVFDKKKLDMNGSYTLDEFVQVMKEL